MFHTLLQSLIITPNVVVFLCVVISLFLLLLFLVNYKLGSLLFSALLPLWLLGGEFRINILGMFDPDLSMIILLLMGMAFFSQFLLKADFKNVKIPHSWLISTFFIIHICSLLYGGINPWGLKIMVTLVFGLFVYVLVVLSTEDLKLLERMFQFILIFSSIVLILLIYRYMFVFHSPFMGNDPFESTEYGKSKLGIFLVVFTPVMLSYTIYHRNWIAVMGLTVFLSSLVYSVCRGAYIGVFGAIVFLLIVSKYRKVYLKIVIPTIISIVVVVTIFVPQLASQIIEEMTILTVPGNLTEHARLVWIQGGLNAFYAHPVFGIGLGNFSRLWFPIPPYTESLSHNDYVKILAEQGIIGILVFVALFGGILVGLIKVLKESVEHARWLQEGIAASLVSILIFFFTLNFSYVLPLWFLLGSSAAILNLDRKRKRRTADVRFIHGKRFVPTLARR